MSSVSKIYKGYDKALKSSQKKFNDLYSNRARNAEDFYQAFFKNLICPFSSYFNSEASRRFTHQKIELFFETKQIDFVAIDGTSAKDPFQDFIVFSACAYGARGQVNLDDEPPTVRYQKWSLEKDVSMVTYIPVSFSEFADVADGDRRETFLVSDSERVDLSNIDTRIMELAEIYLAYNVATSSAFETPKVIMLDRSLSSVFADVALQPEAAPMVLNYRFDRRALTVEDATVALAHPFNRELGVPTLKRFRQYMVLIAEFHDRRSKEINLEEFASRYGVSVSDLDDVAIKYLTTQRKGGQRIISPFARIENRHGVKWLVTDVDCVSSWDYCLGLFENICRRLFINKEQEALMYEAPDEQGVIRLRWMSPEDIRFLIAIGVRGLIEKFWERKILLTGIAKDSSSRYLTRNYLGVMKYIGNMGYPELSNLDVKQLPWSDRIFLELLPLIDEELEAPWASIEFDSIYMTLHAREENGQPKIAGVKNYIVSPERLFSRSLAQFFLKREKLTPLMGHVIFVDRLVYPEWDQNSLDRITIDSNKELGKIQPLFYQNNEELPNIGQIINMYILNVLTRNHFPEVIGYPDPLHKADWGAKSVGRRIKGIIQSSSFAFRSQPLSKTFRDIRE